MQPNRIPSMLLSLIILASLPGTGRSAEGLPWLRVSDDGSHFVARGTGERS